MAHQATTRDECGEETPITTTVLGMQADVLVDWAVIRKGTVTVRGRRDSTGDTRYAHLTESAVWYDEAPVITEPPEIEITRVVFDGPQNGLPQLYTGEGAVYDLQKVMAEQEKAECLKALHNAIASDYNATGDLFYLMKVYWVEEEVIA